MSSTSFSKQETQPATPDSSWGQVPADLEMLLEKQGTFSLPNPTQVTFSDVRTMNDYFHL